MNNRGMFGKDEKEWREYKWCSEEKETNGASQYWSIECLHIG